ncbi:hypothetical protein BKA70DRAFT_1241874 [Coprinopsis sp. MPI-PUGE-AT-0042]|nr:hypothetical protein BKA70DRAFT_1241874 [Coprinopsis sp. MPI-PUGE-AT-0042]
MGDWEGSGGHVGGLASVVRGSASLLKAVAELGVCSARGQGSLGERGGGVAARRKRTCSRRFAEDDIPLAMEDIERVPLDEEAKGREGTLEDMGLRAEKDAGIAARNDKINLLAAMRNKAWPTRRATPALGTRSCRRSGETVSTATSSTCEAFQATGSFPLAQVMDGETIRALRAPNDGDILQSLPSCTLDFRRSSRSFKADNVEAKTPFDVRERELLGRGARIRLKDPSSHHLPTKRP